MMEGQEAILIAVNVVLLIFVATMVASMWKIFAKAGQPGWAVLIPFYNLYIMLKIAGKSPWWIAALFIPVVGAAVVGIVCALGMAKNFGKDTGFAVGLLLAGFIFYPILGFGSAEYQHVQGQLSPGPQNNINNNAA